MTNKFQTKAHLLLEKAEKALHGKDIKNARKFALEAVKLDVNLEEGWLILASISKPKKSIELLKRALEINPRSEKARLGMRWAVREFRKEQHNTSMPPSAPTYKEKTDRVYSYQWALTLFLSLVILGSVLIFSYGLPAVQAQT